MSVTFALRLLDMTTGPARAAGAALAKVQGQLSALQKASGANLGAPLASIAKGAGSAASSLSAVGAAATAVLGPLALVGGGLVAAGAAYAGNLAKFGEDSMFAFKNITGSQEKAAEIVTMADEMARSMGAKTTDVTKSLRELMGSGFDVTASKAIVSAQMDIRSINPDANLANMNQALAKMAGSGKFNLEQAEAVLGAGVNDDMFYSILTKITGSKNRGDVFKKISAGMVSDKQGLDAMLQAVQQMQGGGPLGSASAEKSKTTVSGAMNNALAMFERLFKAINTSAVGAKLIELANIAARLFDPAQPGGKRFLGLLDRTTDLALKVFDGIDSGKVTAAFDAIISAGNSVLSFLQPIVQGFKAGFGEAASSVRMIVDHFGIGQGPTTSMASALKLVGTAIGWIVVGIGVAVGAIGFLVAKIAGVAVFMWGAAASIGIAIISGITGGIDSAKAGLIANLKALAELLPDAVRKLLKIQSPSKVFADIGVNTMRGFEVGILRGPDPSMLVADRMQVPAPPSIDARGALLASGLAPEGSSARSVNVDVTFQRIEVNGNIDPEEFARMLGKSMRAEVTTVFERMALTSGGMVPA
jgi:hypothetical protein